MLSAAALDSTLSLARTPVLTACRRYPSAARPISLPATKPFHLPATTVESSLVAKAHPIPVPQLSGLHTQLPTHPSRKERRLRRIREWNDLLAEIEKLLLS
jgi:hypothetical protein